jgi:alpha-L-fucosidase
LERATGPREVLDMDEFSYVVGAENGTAEIILDLPEATTLNRFVLQEAISTHGQRIEEHALDVWLEGTWEKVATGTTVGYKKILRFPAVETDKFRIRVLKSRLEPTISNISAHFYKSQPPQIHISRDKDGIVILKPEQHQFKWKSHGIDATGNLNKNLEIRYTLDGSKPSKKSKLYSKPFLLKSGELRTRAFELDRAGGETSEKFGMLKGEWTLLDESSIQGYHHGENAFDDDPDTYWQSKENKKHPQHIAVDLGKVYTLHGFAYTPQTIKKTGMIEKGTILISVNGKKWEELEYFEFGNLINDPTKRTWNFQVPVDTRYIRISSEAGAGNSNVAAIAELDFFEK